MSDLAGPFCYWSRTPLRLTLFARAFLWFPDSRLRSRFGWNWTGRRAEAGSDAIRSVHGAGLGGQKFKLHESYQAVCLCDSSNSPNQFLLSVISLIAFLISANSFGICWRSYRVRGISSSCTRLWRCSSALQMNSWLTHLPVTSLNLTVPS